LRGNKRSFKSILLKKKKRVKESTCTKKAVRTVSY